MTNALQTNISMNATHMINVQIPYPGPIWTVITGLFLLVSFAIAVLTLRRLLAGHIAKALEKKEVIERLSLLVKPDMVFDQTESVLADRGASAVIRERGIHVKMGGLFGKPDTRQVPVEILIEFSKHLAVPPLLTALNADVVTITTKRGKNFDWLYILDYSMGGDYDESYTHKYRLEIF
jgi:hypothetical protein